MSEKNGDLGACKREEKTCRHCKKGRSSQRAVYTSCNKHGKFLEYKDAHHPELNSCDYPAACADYEV